MNIIWLENSNDTELKFYDMLSSSCKHDGAFSVKMWKRFGRDIARCVRLCIT